jgi:hypothetical protein
MMPLMVTAQSTCSRRDVTRLHNGQYNFQMNENDSAPQECAKIDGTGFTITTASFNLPTNGAPGTYTSVYRGCHWGTCTGSSPFPIQESNIASATTSVNLTQPSGYNNDAAYDIWFNQTSTTSGQPNGTEVMIWLNHQGPIQPFGSQTATTTINGTNYEVWTGSQRSWKIISYRASTPVNGVTDLNLLPFFTDAVSRGSLDPSSWLIDVEFGFEIWAGGKGLAMSDFSVSATPRSASSAVPSAAGTRSGANVAAQNMGYNGTVAGQIPLSKPSR